MAGGRGERFWPQSRTSHPKQLLRLMGSLTMVEQAVERLCSFVAIENIIIVTNREYVNAMRQLLRRIPPENIIGEEFERDTAPCMALAVGMIKRRSGGDPVIVVSPSDHIIRNLSGFRAVMEDAIAVASERSELVLLGVQPRFANTGFGYIMPGGTIDTVGGTEFRKVERFVEKPDIAAAESFIESGGRWNSGLFVWRASSVMEAMREHAPELYSLATQAAAFDGDGDITVALSAAYERMPKMSIDYALIEKYPALVMAEADFDWEDVGSWSCIRSQTRPDGGNNAIRGLVATLDTKDCCIVSTPSHLVAAVDVEGLIIVHTDDATLICAEHSAQRVKELVEELGRNPETRKFL